MFKPLSMTKQCIGQSLFWLCLGLNGVVVAEEPPVPAESELISDLLNALNTETEIATKTKRNIDHVPGMVSVLYGKDLLEQGKRNVFEALGTIPGVELNLANDGQSVIIVRGIGRTFASGKVRIMVNGQITTAALSGSTLGMSMPLEQVDRIEVIRGPGSAVYGEFALVATINIITKKDSNEIAYRHNDVDRKVGGVVVSARPDNQHYSLSYTREEYPGGDTDVDSDVLTGTVFDPISYAPGPINDKEKASALVGQADIYGYKITAQQLYNAVGDFYGQLFALPSPQQRIMREAWITNVYLSKDWSLSDDWLVKMNLGGNRYKLRSGPQEFYPPGFLGVYTESMVGGANYTEQMMAASVEAQYDGMASHQWLFGAEYKDFEQGDTWALRNFDPATLLPVPLDIYTGNGNWIEEDKTRYVKSVYLQDQYKHSDQLLLTAGVRVDRYSDVDGDTSPRLAGVYHLSDSQIIKAQYSSSFRPPMFFELYSKNNPVANGNPDLKPETVDSYELGYIHTLGASRFRSTLYYNKLKNLVVIDPVSATYMNRDDTSIWGLELEYLTKLLTDLTLNTNISYLKGDEDEGLSSPTVGVAEVIGNLTFVYTPFVDTKFSANYHYLGSRDRNYTTGRDSLDSEHVVNLSGNFANLGVDHFTFRVTVNNVFDTDVVYPSHITSFPPGSAARPAYEDGYRTLGREVWLQAQYEFL